MEKKLLVLDDEESICWILKKGLEKRGYTVVTKNTGNDGLEALVNEEFFMAFIDILLPDVDGINLLRQLKKKNISTPIVIMTAQGTSKNAIRAMKEGAYDYITKPFEMEEIYYLVKKLEELDHLHHKVTALEELCKKQENHGEFIGKSKGMQGVFKSIGKVASSDITVLITGESGTGKELVSRALHKNSGRADMPFVAVNCAAIPHDLMESELFGYEKGAFTGATEIRKGKFELADRGTLFLDEIGDLSLNVQSKFLRAIQEQEFYRIGGKVPIKIDVRLITATNKNLEKLVLENNFREDLFHRLNVFTIHIPPLRERSEDIALLSKSFVEKYAKQMNMGTKVLSKESVALLEKQKWDGNVRELENSIKRAVVLTFGRTITPEAFYKQIPFPKILSAKTLSDNYIKTLNSNFQAKDGEVYNMVISEVERALLKHTLEKTNGNQIKTAQILGINRNTLARKIKELNIKKENEEKQS